MDFMMSMKSIKYLSIKYSSRGNKLIVNVLDIVKITIFNTYVLNTIRIFDVEIKYFELVLQKF